MTSRYRFGLFVTTYLTLLFLSPGAFAFTIISLGNDILDVEDLDPAGSPSTLITDPTTLDTNIKSVTKSLSGRVQGSFNRPALNQSPSVSNIIPRETKGISAGDPAKGIGVWASYSYTDYENDFSQTPFEGRTHTALIGIDFMPSKNTIIGLAFGFEDSKTDTPFNQGEVETDGYTIAPYMGVSITDNVSADVSFGYSKLTNEQELALISPAIAQVNSEFDSKRWFATANLNGFYTHNNWLLSSQFGVLWTKNEQESYTETITGLAAVLSPTRFITSRDSRLKQFHITGEAAYSIDQFEPYARVSYVRDFSRTSFNIIDPSSPTPPPQPSNDKDDFLVGGGLRVFAANGFSGSFDYSKRLGREDLDEDIVSFFLRMDL